MAYASGESCFRFKSRAVLSARPASGNHYAVVDAMLEVQVGTVAAVSRKVAFCLRTVAVSRTSPISSLTEFQF